MNRYVLQILYHDLSNTLALPQCLGYSDETYTSVSGVRLVWANLGVSGTAIGSARISWNCQGFFRPLAVGVHTLPDYEADVD